VRTFFFKKEKEKRYLQSRGNWVVKGLLLHGGVGRGTRNLLLPSLQSLDVNQSKKGGFLRGGGGRLSGPAGEESAPFKERTLGAGEEKDFIFFLLAGGGRKKRKKGMTREYRKEKVGRGVAGHPRERRKKA